MEVCKQGSALLNKSQTVPTFLDQRPICSTSSQRGPNTFDQPSKGNGCTVTRNTTLGAGWIITYKNPEGVVGNETFEVQIKVRNSDPAIVGKGTITVKVNDFPQVKEFPLQTQPWQRWQSRFLLLQL